MKENGFTRFYRDEKNLLFLARSRPSALILLLLIVTRARWSNEEVLLDNIEVGECYIGDYEKLGSTRQKYRSDVNFLKKLKIIEVKITSKGSVAKLLPNPLFEVEQVSNQPATNQQTNQQLTSSQPLNKRIKDKSVVYSKKNTHTHGLCVKTLGYGIAKSVLICEIQHRKLCQLYGRRPVNKKIKELEAYMLSKGVSYKDHYFTLVSFLLKDRATKKWIPSEDDFSPSDFDSHEAYEERISKINQK